ncbi:MAG TPA: c-type cytochrome [Bryobacteraceae bacterium]|nr:c-type cytochrome [Bryobacteraceae bacterium]
MLAALATAQTPAQPPAGRGGRGGGGGGGFANAFPQHPPADPAMVERGKALYGVNCQFCHGGDARGGEGGPNLIRAEIVLNDQNGELIAPVVQNGRVDQGMPKFPMTNAQVADIAAFIHSFRVAGYDNSRMKPPTIVVGDAAAGEAYFKSKCATCHSVSGDLKGIGAKYAEDPRALQQIFVMPGGGGRGRGATAGNVPPTTVTVTPASGPKVEGRLVRVDDFIVTLAEADGTQRTFRRDGDRPKVEIHDPLQPHKDLLRVYSDKDIHNLTAYLVTVK